MRKWMMKREQQDQKILSALVILVASYVLTAGCLLLLAFILYKFRISENVVNMAVIVIYICMTFFAGFVAGKRFKVKKFLWGLILGSVYFLILTVVSMIGGVSDMVVGRGMITTYLLCAGGGMLGGMLSQKKSLSIQKNLCYNCQRVQFQARNCLSE